MEGRKGGGGGGSVSERERVIHERNFCASDYHMSCVSFLCQILTFQKTLSSITQAAHKKGLGSVCKWKRGWRKEGSRE